MFVTHNRSRKGGLQSGRPIQNTGSKIHISDNFIIPIIIDIKTSVLLADVLLLMLKRDCIDDFIFIFV